MNPKPRPSWYVAAGMGKPFTATTDELVAALKHPARSVRMVAQRRLVDRAKEAVAPLRVLLKDANAPAAARWHAIWTLDAIDGGQVARADLAAIARDSKINVSVRRQAVRQLGRTHDANVVAPLGAALQDSDASLRFQAATALGRIGNVSAVAPLLETLAREADFFTRYATFTALNRIGRAEPAAWPAILDGLNGPTPQAKQYTTFAVRETYDAALVKALAAYACDTKHPADSRALAVTALAALHKHPKPWDGKWWNTQPAITPPPAKVIAWEGTDAVASAIATALGDNATEVRIAAIQAANIAPDARHADALSNLFKQARDPKLHSDVLRALAAASPDAASGFARDVLANPAANAAVLPAVIDVAQKIGEPGLNEAMIAASAKPLPADSLALLLNSLGQLKNTEVIPAIARHVSSRDAAVATSALEALAHAGGERATQSILPALSDSRPEIRRAAVSALASNPSLAVVDPLIKAYADPATRREAILALAKTPDVRALDAYLEGLGSPDATLRDPARNAIKEIAPQARTLIESKLDKVVLPTQAIDELQRLYSFYVPVEKWMIIGPLPIDSTETVDVANPSTSTSMTGIKGPAGWRKGKPQARGMIDLGKQLKYDGKGIAYAVAHIDAPAARDVELVTGSDDSMTLWLNGVQVMSDPNDSAWNPEEQRTKASLKAGDNVLVAKLGNRSGYWQFSASVSAERTGKLFEYDTHKLDPALYASFAMDHKGNAEGGKKVFFNPNGVGCAKCHKATIGGEGGEVGPALAGVGAKYDRAKLIESILYPSKQIFDGYQQTLVRTKSAKTFAGSVRGETETDFTLIDANGVTSVIRKADVDKRKVSQLSLMPEGLHAALKPEEFSDLVSYLQSLKEAPAAK
jgi:putative heme-binding domain-containing protein